MERQRYGPLFYGVRNALNCTVFIHGAKNVFNITIDNFSFQLRYATQPNRFVMLMKLMIF